jgi:hypothetical protein
MTELDLEHATTFFHIIFPPCHHGTSAPLAPQTWTVLYVAEVSLLLLFISFLCMLTSVLYLYSFRASIRSAALTWTRSLNTPNRILPTDNNMTSYLSRLSPVPAFPSYTGPHKVGTIDVEFPVSELESPSPTPEEAEGLSTVQYRIFYPCEPDVTGKGVNWIPAPQRGYVSAYTRFLGAGSMLANFIS